LVRVKYSKSEMVEDVADLQHTLCREALRQFGIRRAIEVVPAERLVINPDCGCVHLPRDVAFAKLTAMVEGTKIVRGELK
jgi:methionine synthase II (cobalamin-independent)